MKTNEIRKQPTLFTCSFDGTNANNHCTDCIHRFMYGYKMVCDVHGKSTNNNDSCKFFNNINEKK